MKPGDRFCLRFEDLARAQPGQHIRIYPPIIWPYFWLGEDAPGYADLSLPGPDHVLEIEL